LLTVSHAAVFKTVSHAAISLTVSYAAVLLTVSHAAVLLTVSHAAVLLTVSNAAVLLTATQTAVLLTVTCCHFVNCYSLCCFVNCCSHCRFCLLFHTLPFCWLSRAVFRGLLAVDGELIPTKPIQATVLPSMISILSWWLKIRPYSPKKSCFVIGVKLVKLMIIHSPWFLWHDTVIYILSYWVDKEQCWGSVTFWYGSGDPDPYIWLMDPDAKKLIFFFTFFSLNLPVGTWSSV